VVGNSFDLVFDNFIKTVLMYIVVAGAIRDVRDVERLAAAYLVAAAVYAAVVISRFELGDGDAWRLGRLYYYDANDFATFLVSAMPLGLYFAHAGRRRAVRLLALVALLVLTIAFVRTGSRGGFLALVVAVGFVLLRYRAIATRWRVCTFVVAALLLAATASEQYWRQMGTILSDADYNQTEETGRLQIWRRGVGYMLQYPVLGVGPNNFQTAEGTRSPFADREPFGKGVRWNAPHSSFIQVGAELGIAGLALFVTLIVSAFAALRNGARLELTQAITASLIGFVVGACFLSLAYSEMLYTLVAFAVGLRKVTT
jgi:O-antigen ligase